MMSVVMTKLNKAMMSYGNLKSRIMGMTMKVMTDHHQLYRFTKPRMGHFEFRSDQIHVLVERRSTMLWLKRQDRQRSSGVELFSTFNFFTEQMVELNTIKNDGSTLGLLAVQQRKAYSSQMPKSLSLAVKRPNGQADEKETLSRNIFDSNKSAL